MSLNIKQDLRPDLDTGGGPRCGSDMVPDVGPRTSQDLGQHLCPFRTKYASAFQFKAQDLSQSYKEAHCPLSFKRKHERLPLVEK